MWLNLSLIFPSVKKVPVNYAIRSSGPHRPPRPVLRRRRPYLPARPFTRPRWANQWTRLSYADGSHGSFPLTQKLVRPEQHYSQWTLSSLNDRVEHGSQKPFRGITPLSHHWRLGPAHLELPCPLAKYRSRTHPHSVLSAPDRRSWVRVPNPSAGNI
jgi:hypothetical protein